MSNSISNSCMYLAAYSSSNFSYEQHARERTAKAAKISDMVIKLFCTREPEFMAPLYTSPSPRLSHFCIVTVQQDLRPARVSPEKYIKCIKSKGNLSYEERLHLLVF